MLIVGTNSSKTSIVGSMRESIRDNKYNNRLAGKTSKHARIVVKVNFFTLRATRPFANHGVTEFLRVGSTYLCPLNSGLRINAGFQ